MKFLVFMSIFAWSSAQAEGGCWQELNFKSLKSEPVTGEPVVGDSAASDSAAGESVAGESKNQPIEVLYHAETEVTAQRVLELAIESDKELESFFGVQRKTAYQIVIAKDSNVFFQVSGFKHTWNAVGMAISGSKSLIFNPEKWDPRNSHIRLKELIKHEMTHSFDIAFRNHPQDPAENSCSVDKTGETAHYWLNEGIAVFASGQLQTWSGQVQPIVTSVPMFSIVKSMQYATMGAAVHFLINEFGRDRFFDAVKTLSVFECAQRSKQSECDQKFFQALGTDFVDLEKKWRAYVREFWR